MANKIINNVVGGETLAWDILKTYEFNSLKSSDSRDISKLKNAIVNSGFSFPIYIWHEHRYVIDGKGRDIALSELEKEGYVIPDLPVSYIKADNKAQAKRLALQDLQPLDFEMFDLGLDLELEVVDTDDFESEYQETETKESSAKEVDTDDFEMKHQCPKCGFEYD